LKASIDGKLNYSGIIQQNQNVNINQDIFLVNPGNLDFFGEIEIPQYNMGKVKEGQKTIIKFKSYPFEQYGIITGKLDKISDVALKDSIFVARISFDKIKDNGFKNKIVLKNGLLAEADIITEESSLLERFVRNIFKTLNQ
jgi:HlyD family secretion protein